MAGVRWAPIRHCANLVKLSLESSSTFGEVNHVDCQWYLIMKNPLSTKTGALLLLTISIVAGIADCAAKTPKNSIPTRSITEAEVRQAQKNWGDGIVAIGNAYTKKRDYKALATSLVDRLYAYDEDTVLFKPTKAAAQQFRLTEPDAISYFVTGGVPEDHGFALQPWSAVRFENAGIVIDADSAVAMGNYFFTDANTGKEVKAEFTFGYVRGTDGNLLINVHHSAFPYQPSH